MSCASINIKCLKGNYIETDSGEQLFTGMEINLGGNTKVFIKAPYQAVYKNGSVKLKGADGIEYNFRINKTKYSVNGLKTLIADCNCCAGDDEVGNHNYLVKDETQLPLNPSQGDIALYEDTPRIDIFDGVSWQTVDINKLDWHLTGNSVTDNTNKFGTNNNNYVELITNGVSLGRLTIPTNGQTGQLHIGNNVGDVAKLGSDSYIAISRITNAQLNSNEHAFVDATTMIKNKNGFSFASFDTLRVPLFIG